ncbi:MAG: hypothetical protein RL154_1661, partial [Pseudomonadota bacterium]
MQYSNESILIPIAKRTITFLINDMGIEPISH